MVIGKWRHGRCCRRTWSSEKLLDWTFFRFVHGVNDARFQRLQSRQGRETRSELVSFHFVQTYMFPLLPSSKFVMKSWIYSLFISYLCITSFLDIYFSHYRLDKNNMLPYSLTLCLQIWKPEVGLDICLIVHLISFYFRIFYLFELRGWWPFLFLSCY